MRIGIALAVLMLVSALSVSRLADAGTGIATLQPPGRENIGCAGGETLHAVATHWAAAFQALHPNIGIQIRTTGKLSADGFTDLLEGRSDCVLMVREPFPAETREFQRRFARNIGLLRVATGSFATKGATHAIAIYANNANPLRHLTLEQLEAVFGATPRSGSEPIVKWNQLGVQGALGERPVHVYGMTPRRETGNPPGIVNYLQQTVLGGGEWRKDLRIQTDTPTLSALQGIVRQVAQDPAGIGYSGFGFKQAGTHALALAASPDDPSIEGSPASVSDRTYPLTRSLYIAFDPDTSASTGSPLCEFLLYILSPEAQHALSGDPQHFLALPARDLGTSRQTLLTLTHGRCR